MKGRTTLTAFVESNRLCFQAVESSFLLYDQFRLAWNSFAAELFFNDVEAFKCQDCEKTPQIVLFDGTFLACRKDLMVIPPVEVGECFTPSSTHADRVFLRDKNHQKILQKIASTNQDNLITHGNFQSALENFAKEPSLQLFLRAVMIWTQVSKDNFSLFLIHLLIHLCSTF